METVHDLAYQLMIMLGEIQNEMKKGGDTISISEIDELYNMASEIYNHFETNI